jgi:hypothetical protein
MPLYSASRRLDSCLVRPLLVAAGGGGDAVAALMLPRPEGDVPAIATWAWDRLMIDPLPGPRGVDDFDGVWQPQPDVNLIRATTTARPPAGSTLPPLAEALATELVLLDPHQGCRGLTKQLWAAARWCEADRLVVVDVGGDVLARPGDPGLRSPLADITTLVASVNTELPTELVILGVGCDGELAPELVFQRLGQLDTPARLAIDPDRVCVVLPILEWHPSEATALVAMSTLGYRGTVEIRDRGLPVRLDEDAGTAWRLPATKALPPSALTTSVAATTSLEALERVFRDAFSLDEIDYERRKAAELANGSRTPQVDSSSFLAAAASRGVDWVTRRRMREATGSVPKQYARALLVPTNPAGTLPPQGIGGGE